VTAYPGTPTKPAKFTVPASTLLRQLGHVPGGVNQTISTEFRYPFGTTPTGGHRAFRIPACKPALGIMGIGTCEPGGSFSLYGPYIYSYSYADLRNQAGDFFAGNGYGAFVYEYKPQGAGVAGRVIGKLKPAGKQFGGTMAMLGFIGANAAYYRNGGNSIGSLNWLFDAIGNAATTNIGGVDMYTATTLGVFYNIKLSATSFSDVVANAWPWTTGTVTVSSLQRGPFESHFRRTGYDNRTHNGEGTIQLVSPVMTHWLATSPGFQYATVGVGILTLTFAPEPTKVLMLGAGLSLLALLYRAGRGRA
jgi:hypothetical protein